MGIVNHRFLPRPPFAQVYEGVRLLLFARNHASCRSYDSAVQNVRLEFGIS
jgi:hypothetical protein